MPQSAEVINCTRCWVPGFLSQLRQQNGRRQRTPRTSIAERYTNRQAYMDRVNKAGARLVADRFLLAEDLPAVVKRAGDQWDLLNNR
jgi:hypothetical protein